MTLARWFMIGAGLIYFALGIAVIRDPAALASLIESDLATATARVETRSAAGLYLGLGAFFAIAGIRRPLLRAGLLLWILANLGILAGRFWGVLEDGVNSAFTAYSALFEIVAILPAVYFLRKHTETV